ncbi:MAG TPA: type III pantothenate kinase [Candidatus Cloacimonadota bacterium]|nr:type III pantothenate kinase [Candidatus Cloacimonadota bacterium]HQL14311.1 type III pantothenate kinase [Candidatus Cloacimonadota bacterium]
MNTLVIDIGNSNTVCGIYSEGTLSWSARFKSDRDRTADEYFVLLQSLAKENISNGGINKVAIAGVVPDLTRKWQHLIKKYFSLNAIIISAYSPLGLSYVVPDPGFIGADLVANAFAGWKKYKSNCLIIDFGTATTLQIVTAEGKFLGAIIAPGMITAAAELFRQAALLSEIELTLPKTLLGTNTKDAMLSGIVKGHALMVQGFINSLNNDFAALSPWKIISTGGISDLLIPLLPEIQISDRTLTLDGIYQASELLSS